MSKNLINDLEPWVAPAWAAPFEARVLKAAATQANAMLELAQCVVEMYAVALEHNAPLADVPRLLNVWGGWSNSEVSKLRAIGSSPLLLEHADTLTTSLNTAYLMTKVESEDDLIPLLVDPGVRLSDVKEVLVAERVERGEVTVDKTLNPKLTTAELRGALNLLGVYPAKPEVMSAIKAALMAHTGNMDADAIKGMEALFDNAIHQLTHDSSLIEDAKIIDPVEPPKPKPKPKARSSSARAAQTLARPKPAKAPARPAKAPKQKGAALTKPQLVEMQAKGVAAFNSATTAEERNAAIDFAKKVLREAKKAGVELS